MVRVHWAGEQRGNLDYKGWIYPRKRSGEGADETDQVCFNNITHYDHKRVGGLLLDLFYSYLGALRTFSVNCIFEV